MKLKPCQNARACIVGNSKEVDATGHYHIKDVRAWAKEKAEEIEKEECFNWAEGLQDIENCNLKKLKKELLELSK